MQREVAASGVKVKFNPFRVTAETKPAQIARKDKVVAETQPSAAKSSLHVAMELAASRMAATT